MLPDQRPRIDDRPEIVDLIRTCGALAPPKLSFLPHEKN